MFGESTKVSFKDRSSTCAQCIVVVFRCKQSSAGGMIASSFARDPVRGPIYRVLVVLAVSRVST